MSIDIIGANAEAPATRARAATERMVARCVVLCTKHETIKGLPPPFNLFVREEEGTCFPAEEAAVVDVLGHSDRGQG